MLSPDASGMGRRKELTPTRIQCAGFCTTESSQRYAISSESSASQQQEDCSRSSTSCHRRVCNLHDLVLVSSLSLGHLKGLMVRSLKKYTFMYRLPRIMPQQPCRADCCPAALCRAIPVARPAVVALSPQLYQVSPL